MLSFQDYASPQTILKLLIKERVKAADKKKLVQLPPPASQLSQTNPAHLTVAQHISLLMPPRDTWRKPQRRDRYKKDSDQAKSKKQILAKSLALTIRHDRKHRPQAPYLQRLDQYIQSLRQEILSTTPLTFHSLLVTGQYKKTKTETITTPDGQSITRKVHIQRPITIFASLTEKLLVALACNYLSQAFDPFLHEEILSYRPLRHYHGSTTPIITDRNNGIANLLAFRRAYRHTHLYVCECDIQKYFDTINHDVIRTCFQQFADKARQKFPHFSYSSVSRIIDAYLNSYSFYRNVIVENRHLEQSNPPRRFEGVDTQLFIQRGCYTPEQFAHATDHIGIPQGGALSTLISNVVLHTIDTQSILRQPDPNRFFCRFGDDILLVHTSKQKCQQLISSYCQALTQNKLLYHEFVSVSAPEFRTSDGRGTRPLLWEQKSRTPYLWGRKHGEPESVDWIGFLGYEIRYTGEVRLRRSSMNDKFKGIKRKYRSIAKTRLVRGTAPQKELNHLHQTIQRQLQRFAGEGLSSAIMLTRNKYSITQARKLDLYQRRNIFNLLFKAARRNHLPSGTMRQWWQQAKDMGCFNYIRTLGHRHS